MSTPASLDKVMIGVALISAIYIERNIAGLKIPNLVQSVEAFCEDVNVMTSDEQDLVIVDQAVTLFEQVSGAILSRRFLA